MVVWVPILFRNMNGDDLRLELSQRMVFEGAKKLRSAYENYFSKDEVSLLHIFFTSLSDSDTRAFCFIITTQANIG